jgi:ribA/ribD-fused uncharacterized protein
MIDRFDGEFEFLSNFYPSEVLSPTLEHHFQASKVVNLDWFCEIREAETPGKAKRLGRQAPLRSNWNQIKDKVMLDLVRKKFTQPNLRQLLLATGTETLVEGNTWHDNYWGACIMQYRHKPCWDEIRQNKLGHILMRVRREIKGPEQSSERSN